MIQQMYAEIQRQTDKHSVTELCGIYGVSRSGYYKWCQRQGKLNRLVMRPAERLLKRTESTGRQVLFHSDQGVQYSSAGYCNLLTQYNVHQSMSRAGVPRDNAVMESFWGRFKDTLRKHFRFWERDDLHDVVAECVHYFNFVRPVRKLNGKPPVLFRTELVA